ncbi:MAG: hypothetical protein PUA75_02860 [Clostridiales bacterium]|nr:hypothetical protein [Clostridiales bacterium]
MQKSAVKAAVLSIIFVVSVMIFGMLTNHVNEDLTTEMPEATLPVISLFSGETEINELYGYKKEMNAAYMRDTITPVDDSRRLPIQIRTYQKKIDGISYEIRSLNGERLIANADVTDYEEKAGSIKAELEIQNLLQEGEEYLLLIKLACGDENISYYTRIMEPIGCHVEECLAFVKEINEKTFNEETSGTLATYMEKPTGDNTTLQFVSLNSSLKQMAWANFKGEPITTPVPSVKEITDTYNVIVLEYVVASIGENGESEYFNVEEYYRVRYTSNRIYLLNFERTMNEIFRGENAEFYENYIQLGIRSKDVEYQANEAGNIVTFVQEGELWCYNETENNLAKVFSFRGYEGIDSRENNGEHEIKVVSIDEVGSVDYIVYGYMNRGNHEGEVGISVYHYDSLANTNEELVFLPSDKSYEIMKSELGQLMYVNEGGVLYIMVDGSVYGIDLNTLEIRELVKGLQDGKYAMSESNGLFAWVDEDTGSDTIHVMNFTNEKITDITESGEKYVKPLGFMQEDFVYGVANVSDVFEDAAGNVTVPMYQIKIVDVSGKEQEILKVYEKEGYFVSSIEIEDYTMYLNRIRYNGTAYVEADRDMIMNREGDSLKVVDVHTSSSEIKQTQVQLSLANQVSEKQPRLLTPKETILEDDRTVALNNNNDTERYYVYVKGDVIATSESVTEAIKVANEKMGVVISDSQQYVWKRSRKAQQGVLPDIVVGVEDANAGSIAQCINAMLEKEGINISVSALIAGGETPKNILKNTMKDARILDLTGCSIEEVLYYVSCGNPVFAMTGSSDAVLLVGYDANNVIVFNPVENTTGRQSISDAGEVFADAGNVFFTYLEK